MIAETDVSLLSTPKIEKWPHKRGGVPVVQISDRLGQALFEIPTNVVARPVSMNEIRRALRAEHSVRARGAGRIQPNRNHVGKLHAGLRDGDLQAVLNLFRQTSGPCLESAGCSHSPSIRNFARASTSV